MRYWDKRTGKTLQKYEVNRYWRNSLRRSRAMAAFLIPWALLGACDGPKPIAAEKNGAETVAVETSKADCGQDGQLIVELYGVIRASINWQTEELSCTGMPRPDGEGARIRLSGRLGTDDDVRTLAFILGLPDLKVGQTGTELPTNVTLIEEGAGRFYRTRDASECWTDIASQELIGDDSDTLYRVEGTLYCVSSLGELNSSASVTFTELKFTGRINWNQP